MRSNDELKENDIENQTRYYFDNIIKIQNFDFNNILVDQKSYENILIYNISYKTLVSEKPLRISFDKVDGFIIVYDGTRYLVLFSHEKHGIIYNRIRHLHQWLDKCIKGMSCLSLLVFF